MPDVQPGITNFMSDALFELAETVRDQESFLCFVQVLILERSEADALSMTPDGFQGDWANHSIASFFDSAVRWAQDSSFGGRTSSETGNPWRFFALFLVAGQAYE